VRFVVSLWHERAFVLRPTAASHRVCVCRVRARRPPRARPPWLRRRRSPTPTPRMSTPTLTPTPTPTPRMPRRKRRSPSWPVVPSPRSVTWDSP
jgi:hypothetical protein